MRLPWVMPALVFGLPSRVLVMDTVCARAVFMGLASSEFTPHALSLAMHVRTEWRQNSAK